MIAIRSCLRMRGSVRCMLLSVANFEFLKDIYVLNIINIRKIVDVTCKIVENEQLVGNTVHVHV